MKGKGNVLFGLLPALGVVLACGSEGNLADSGAEGGEGGDSSTDPSGGKKSDGGTSGRGGKKSDGGTSGEGGDGGSAGKPVTCEGGQFESKGSCTDWTTCKAGEYVSREGSATKDRECTKCTEGYTTGKNATECTAWTTCDWQAGGHAKKGTPTSDAECGTPSPFRQIGAGDYDSVTAVAVDASGNVYVTGFTEGALVGDGTGSFDVFVRKYDPSGDVIWTDQFGTLSIDRAYGLAVDGSGNVYVAGQTGDLLEEEGAHYGIDDGFVRKYTPNGKVVWTRQFGSDSSDIVYALAVDASGNSYVVGRTDGVVGSASFGSSDAFLRKYDPDGELLWSTQWGGSPSTSWDEANAVAVDSDGNIYVAGMTDGVVTGISNYGGRDVFVKKFSAAGLTTVTTQFGTSSDDYVEAVVVSEDGLYLAGTTFGDLGGPNAGSADAYVRKLAASGFGLVWTKQLGTSGYDEAKALAVGAGGNLYVVGNTAGDLAGSVGSEDCFLRVFSSDGDVLNTHQFGSPPSDRPTGIAIDTSQRGYVTGTTKGALQGPVVGVEDGFVMQLLVP
jgi:hypothetical protein